MFNFLNNWAALFKKSGDQREDFENQMKWFSIPALKTLRLYDCRKSPYLSNNSLKCII